MSQIVIRATLGLMLLSFLWGMPSAAWAEAGSSTNGAAGSRKRTQKAPAAKPQEPQPADPLAAPKPAPPSRKPIPTAFSKAAPGSIGELRNMETHLKALIKRLTPAVVAIEVGYANGSGVIISENGLVLTAGHVAGRPNRNVRFTLSDGRSVRGKTLGMLTEPDLGLMQITEKGPWPSAGVAGPERTRLGDWVLAMGHPGGYDSKRSLVVRSGRIIRIGSDAVQTDCTISPGDSGGPLFDVHGRVIAINNAISDSLSANFHVPVSLYLEHWADLVKGQGEDRAATAAVRP